MQGIRGEKRDSTGAGSEGEREYVLEAGCGVCIYISSLSESVYDLERGILCG